MLIGALDTRRPCSGRISRRFWSRPVASKVVAEAHGGDRCRRLGGGRCCETRISGRGLCCPLMGLGPTYLATAKGGQSGSKREDGAHVGIRTRDLFLTKEVLCRLSYVGGYLNLARTLPL